jgi:hypothetical protein
MAAPGGAGFNDTKQPSPLEDPVPSILLAFGIMRHVGAADCHATPLTLARAILAA